ncbi:MAG: SPFH domain-containing protein [Candidatus Wallbacteria bacterium]|nr:SPFH domain-containing protein [Candidatus Wallbacteria bacterium]
MAENDKGRGYLDSILVQIPGFKGYLARENRRDSDKACRDHLAARLALAKKSVGEMKRTLIAAGKLLGIEQLDRVSDRLERVISKVTYAERGYSGFFDSNQIGPEQLEKLQDADRALDALAAIVEQKLTELSRVAAGDDLRPAIQAALDAVESYVPILTKLLSLPYGFNSPFKASVYYVNQKVFTDLKWGTKEPIAFRDTELKMVRLRAFGKYNLKVVEPQIFLNELVGQQGQYMLFDFEGYFRDAIVQRLNDFLGENLKTIFDLPQLYNEIASAMKASVEDQFSKYGLEIRDFVIGAITPPEEVQKMIDQRSSMAAVGDVGQYMQFKAAESMSDFAKSGNPTLGAGIGMGIGASIGSTLHQGLSPQSQAAQQPQVLCPKCKAPNSAGKKFCSECGGPIAIQAETIDCPSCHKPIPASSKFCAECGGKLVTSCPSCNAAIAPGKKFCAECGTKL